MTFKHSTLWISHRFLSESLALKFEQRKQGYTRDELWKALSTNALVEWAREYRDICMGDMTCSEWLLTKHSIRSCRAEFRIFEPSYEIPPVFSVSTISPKRKWCWFVWTTYLSVVGKSNTEQIKKKIEVSVSSKARKKSRGSILSGFDKWIFCRLNCFEFSAPGPPPTGYFVRYITSRNF